MGRGAEQGAAQHAVLLPAGSLPAQTHLLQRMDCEHLAEMVREAWNLLECSTSRAGSWSTLL